ncbi:hypothetical protein VOLCADRAFT_103412 [Volvox carteri f. nagariensis]|uniref:Alcohol dehydrogenase-like N-terminal domain-containing protein n=1 Tax=Volvox carteri f. nagariensis TaxID=3068 RepID=D8TLQ0_VOLCA|nr:uncharacterized protein VOLCADRAFT_103412 [Volvox carteri f. nagariensis]EFJ51367.1 hypothetical protein VOLCADRAFT_103412 [Volvox carteri f. nagariensis]|eukprot:XP_002947319.1 hypothetical protein VOLCADRAFT_103412 [Volvox carteri f. nagariensis]
MGIKLLMLVHLSLVTISNEGFLEREYAVILFQADLEICRGYVPGYCGVLGHEFVGVVVAFGPDIEQPRPSISTNPAEELSSSNSKGNGITERLAVGTRVVGEINCNDLHFTCGDAVYQRNHAPGRSVLGIINRDGALAEYLTLPAANLHPVPPQLAEAEAVFAEPLAAACRILEQGLPARPQSDRVAVIGDGKLGLLVGQVLVRHVAAAGGPRVTLIGRHAAKMALVQGDAERLVSEGDGTALAERLAGQFDLVVEASGSAGGIRTALALCRPMGTVLLKSTVSTNEQRQEPQLQQQQREDDEEQLHNGGCRGDKSGASPGPRAPGWAELANDIVVNEKVLVGSRCGPFDKALELMASDAGVRQLLRSMISAELPLERGEEALELARTKGVLKVQLVMPQK